MGNGKHPPRPCVGEVGPGAQGGQDTPRGQEKGRQSRTPASLAASGLGQAARLGLRRPRQRVPTLGDRLVAALGRPEHTPSPTGHRLYFRDVRVRVRVRVFRATGIEYSCSNPLANSEKKYLATYGSPVGVLTRRDQGCYFHGKPSPRPRDLLALGPAPCLCREGLEVHGGKAPPRALAPRWTSGRRRSRSLRLGPRGPSVWPQQHPREHCFKGVSWTFSQDTCGQGRDKKGGNVLF